MNALFYSIENFGESQQLESDLLFLIIDSYNHDY
jgi:hypothetical protein